MIKNLLSFATSFILIGCNSNHSKIDTPKDLSQDPFLQTQQNEEQESDNTTIINCDSIYPNRKVVLEINKYSEEQSYEPKEYNTTFKIKIGGRIKLNDSIQTHFNEVLFEDFNGDNIKDILIQNISDARSNVTYYLYIVDIQNNNFNKIKGFEEIKNPRYIKEYDLIDNLVVSGTDWSSFYKIVNGRVKNFEKTVNWDDEVKAQKEYEKILKSITKQTKNDR